MARTASTDGKDRSRPWQRAATRAAILAAARRLTDRLKADELSLTAVAREAGFAPATVFAYFANKNHLFVATVTEDIANFARSLHHSQNASDVAATDSSPSPAVEVHAPAEDLRPTAALRLVEQPVAYPEPAPAAAHAESGDSTELTYNTAATSGLVGDVAQLKDTVARLEARPVDQWLERRLRELERGMSALEGRSDKAEAAAALAAVDDSVRKLSARVTNVEARQTQASDDVARAMRERGEQVEKRLREFLSDVDAANARTVTRLDALENAAFAVAPQFFQQHAQPVNAPAEPAKAAAETSATPEAAEPAKPVTLEVVEGGVPSEDSGKSFLAAARRSAREAAEQTTTGKSAGAHSRRLSRRTLYAIAGCLAFVVVLIWTGVYFKALAVPTPQHPVARTVIAAKVQKLALKPDPQSELTAEAESGNAEAELVLGLDLLDGPKKNTAFAARWLAASAGQGEAVAAFKLATLYRAGRGVTADPAKAFHWFAVAAAKGNCKAMQNLAVAYAEGWGTEKNESEAARWFTRAASLGLMDAQFDLGVLYEQGAGVPQNLADAYKWYLIAAAAGDREAEARVDAIKPQLDSSDLAAAEEAAASFKPEPLNRDANVAPSRLQSSAG